MASRASGFAPYAAGRWRGGETWALTGIPGRTGRGDRGSARGGVARKSNLVAFFYNGGIMAAGATPTFRFGDLVALARLSWVGEMTSRLERLGYPGFRRGDAAVMRVLWRGPLPVRPPGAGPGVAPPAAKENGDHPGA